MALSFPTSPSVGDIYTVGARAWRWDGDIWKAENDSVIAVPSLLAWSTLDHASIQSVAANSTTAAAVNAALTVTFTAPASGDVLVKLCAFAYGVVADSSVTWCMLSGGTEVTDAFIYATQIATQLPYNLTFPVTGLTPGASYTWVWGHRGNYAGSAGFTQYGGALGPATFEVWSANTGGVSGEVLAPDDYYELAQTIETVTGTTHSAVIGDIGKLKNTTNGSAVTVTLDTPVSIGITAGARIDFRQGGAGQVTFAAGSGATVNATPGLKTRDQYSGATAIAMSTTEWWLIGDLAV